MINNKRSQYHIVFIFSLFIFFFYCPGLLAQNDDLKPPDPKTVPSIQDSFRVINLEKVKAKQSKIEDSQSLSDSVKKEALTLIEQAIRFLGELDQIEKDREAYELKIKNAPERLKEIQSELKKEVPTDESIDSEIRSSDIKLIELEQKIQQETTNLVTLDGDINKLQGELGNTKGLPQAINEELKNAEQKVEELKSRKKISHPPDEHTAVTGARQISLDTESAKWEKKIQAMKQQLAGHAVYISVLEAELELAKHEKKKREVWLASWKDRAKVLRSIEASQAKLDAEEGRYGISGLPKPVKDEFDINIELADILNRIIREEGVLEKSLETKKTQLKILEEDYNLSKDRAKIFLRTEAIGLALREQRQSLPTFSNYKENSSERRQRMGEIQNALLDVRNQQRALTDIKGETDRIMDSLRPLPEDKSISLQTEVENLLNERQNLLDKLSTEYKRQFRTVQNIEFIDQQTVQLAQQFAQFLDISLMWIQSSSVLGSKDLSNLPNAVEWVINPQNWYAALKDLQKSFTRRPGIWILGLLVVGALMLWRRRVRRGFPKIAAKIGHVQEDSFLLTLKALAMTTYLSMGWPFIILFLGGRLSSLSTPHEFSSALASGLENAAYFLFLYGFFYLVNREYGLAHVHFNWPEQVRKSLQQNLRWLIWILILVIFLMAFCDKSIEFGDSLGRIAFIIGSIAVSIFAGRVLYSQGSIVSGLIHQHPAGLLTRLRYIWSPLIVGIPFAMAVLAALGYYYYTAITFVSRVLDTYNLVIILVIVNALILRWLAITKKRHLLEKTERAEKIEQQKRYEGEDDEKSSPLELGGKAIVVKDSDTGLDQIEEQTRAFLRMLTLFSLLIGLWLVWKELLPAFRSVLDIVLWTYSASVDNITKLLPVTLGNVITAIVTIVITVIVTKNLPGILEIAVLKRLRMDPGSRYAFTTIFRYTIVGLGVIVISNIIGLNWSKLQWLIAALGVGLGFGLQEVVANFICGLVILFERPFQVGDVVTVGETSGAVTRIRIRATTITDWDRHELIVPNKEFITGKLINWTLSDPLERIVIPVGIGHGSDTALAERVLLKVARENPMVLAQPEPSALFLGIDENSLKFELRVFVHGVDKRLPATHQLHQSVDLALKEAGIQIAFPKRDVHFSSKDPVDVRVVSEKGEEED